MSGRRWSLLRALALAAAVAVLSPVSPLVLILVPVAVLLLAYHHRSLLALAVAAACLGALFTAVPVRPGALWHAERAWALLVSGGFVLAGFPAPGRAGLRRSVAAVGLAFAAVALAGLLRPGLVAELDWRVRDALHGAALTAHQWLDATELLPAAGPGVLEAARVQAALYPAFLALASVAALGVGWYVAVRFEGVEEGLGPLREFRFSDQLVWILVAGLVLFLLPVGEWASRLGENAMVFMGGLYLVRGLGILVWLVTAVVTSVWAAALWTLAALLLYPVVVAAALLVGLGDTWLDLRRRLAGAPENGA